MKNITYIVLLFLSLDMFAQNTIMQSDSVGKKNRISRSVEMFKPQLPQTMMPSPTSLNIMRYGNNAPALATGAVKVDIPIYDMKVGNLTIPINLCYTTNGIKVFDSPFPVGFGWILNPGYRITRIVQGRKKDELRMIDVKSASDLIYMPYKDRFEYKRKALMEPSAGGTIDTEYDIFSVNMPNENFKFVIKAEGNNWVALTVGTNCKVTILKSSYLTLPGDNLYFVIEDENGFKYTFGESSNTNQAYETVNPGTFAGYAQTSWGITKIELPGNKVINFQWSHVVDPVLCKYLGGSIDTMSDCFEYQYPGTMTLGVFSDDSGPTCSYSNIMKLNKITFPLGYIDFIYQQAGAGMLLSTIKVIEDINNTIIKEVTFSRDTTGENYVLLNSVSMSTGERFSFQYDLQKFTGRDEYQQDYWGFFNNRSNRLSLAPVVEVKGYRFRDLASPIEEWIRMGYADRSVNESSMQSFILNKVTYPTGGSTTFEYETHRFAGKSIRTTAIHNNYKPPFTKGGGVRLIKQIDRVSDTDAGIITTYKYGENENGLGIAIAEPTIDTFFTQQGSYLVENEGDYGAIERICRLTTVNELSNCTSYLLFSAPIWYNEVSTYTGDTKVTYKYSYDDDSSYNRFDISIINNTYFDPIELYRPETICTWDPLLVEEKMYTQKNADYYLVKKYRYIYSSFFYLISNQDVQPNTINSWSYGPYFTWGNGECRTYYSPSTVRIGDPYEAREYTLDLKKYYLEKKEIVEYAGQDSICSSETYTHKRRNYNNILSSLRRSTSTGTDIVENYLYCEDNLSSLTAEQKQCTNDMTLSNRIATPIQVSVFSNNNFIGKKIIQYKNLGNNLIVPQKEYYADKELLSGECRMNYSQYDNYGNLEYVILDDYTHVVYLWSYKGTYPIAEIKNATYAEVNSALQEQSISIASLRSKLEPSINDMNMVNNLRTKMPNAHITTYAYSPIVGIKTETGPNGKITHYNYDNLGRLINVRDHIGKLLEQYDYHYKP